MIHYSYNHIKTWQASLVLRVIVKAPVLTQTAMEVQVNVRYPLLHADAVTFLALLIYKSDTVEYSGPPFAC